ncbi:MAG TPA: alcohol dehydrogenase catalytic domain-containing protein [Microthrixaceae bacterium]|nr:alcohol dehydrogenase catalytic domain-containing protein [Microthrixaceae bacterium]
MPSSTRAKSTDTLPETHRVAVHTRVGEVVVEDRAVPEAEPGRVVVEVSHCGICGSDIHMIMEGWGRPGSVHGHEYSGVVVAVGDGAEGWLPGDEIVCGASPRCGRCEGCRSGQPSQCTNRHGVMGDDHDGAYARFVSVDARSLLRIPSGLSLRVAALAEPLAVALHGITRSGIVEGQFAIGRGPSAMVFGAGPIGALTAAVLLARGIGPVTVVEPAPSRQRLARDLGVDRVVHPDELPTFGIHQPEELAPHAARVVFECSGKKAAMEAGLQQVARGGTFVMVGAGIEPPTFDGNRILLNELTIVGSYVYDADGFERALDLLASGDLPTDVLIEPDDVPLDGLLDAMTGLARGEIAGKVMIVPAGRAKEDRP